MTVFLHVPQLTVSTGFRAIYSVAESACGGSLTAIEGHLASPGYPNAYPQNAECVWTIGGWPGNRVTLTFQTFNIESSEGCNRDYIEVHDKNEEGVLLLHTCGDTIPATSVTADTQLWVKFNSDGQGVSTGFTAYYSLVYDTNEITGEAGEIVSPMFPSTYFSHMDHASPSWRITVDSGANIMVRFSVFEVEVNGFENHDCLSTLFIYDGFDENAPELLRQCGTELPRSVTSTGNGLFIKLSLHAREYSHVSTNFFFR